MTKPSAAQKLNAQVKKLVSTIGFEGYKQRLFEEFERLNAIAAVRRMRLLACAVALRGGIAKTDEERQAIKYDKIERKRKRLTARLKEHTSALGAMVAAILEHTPADQLSDSLHGLVVHHY